MITSENRAAWQEIASTLSQNNPDGKLVKVVQGRKHLGKTGKVIKIVRDQYGEKWRYVTEAQAMYRSLEQRYGYVALVQQADGQTFWVNATYLEIL